jgi:hypothetical protein
LTREDILAQLLEREPSIFLSAAGEVGVYVNPQTLEPGQETVIVSRILEIIGAQRTSSPEHR